MKKKGLYLLLLPGVLFLTLFMVILSSFVKEPKPF